MISFDPKRRTLRIEGNTLTKGTDGLAVQIGRRRWPWSRRWTVTVVKNTITGTSPSGV